MFRTLRILAALMVGALATGSPAHAEEPRPRAPRAPVPLDGVAAIVDDHFIYRSEVEARAKHFLDKLSKDPVKRRAERAALDQEVTRRLIDELIIAKDAARIHVTATDAEVAAGIDSVAQNNKMDRKGLEAEVAKAGYSLVEYQDEIRRQVLEQKWLLVRSAGKIDRQAASTDPQAFAAAMEKQHEALLVELRKHTYIEIR